MLKKVLYATATAAALLAFTVPAFAEVSVDNSGASVDVTAVNVANSGANSVSASHDGEVDGADVTSGNATSSLTVGTETNHTTVVANCGCEGNIEVDNSGAGVSVEAYTVANSGANSVSANDASVEDVTVGSGNATAATNVQTVTNVTSVTVTGGGEE